jgi:hypothetical protein
MKALFFDLEMLAKVDAELQVWHTSVERAACLFNLPGAENAKALGFLSPVCGFFSFLGRCGRLLCASAMLSCFAISLSDLSRSRQSGVEGRDSSRAKSKFSGK